MPTYQTLLQTHTYLKSLLDKSIPNSQRAKHLSAILSKVQKHLNSINPNVH